MLKSIDFINKLEIDLMNQLETTSINDFFIELKITQKVSVHVVSDTVKSINELSLNKIDKDELSNKNILFIFLTVEQSKDDDYRYLFENGKVSLGLRRTLNTLLDGKDETEHKKQNVMTFFSYKGGVGRTTSLALTATNLARQGKNVFVIDCDLEAPGLLNFFNSAQSAKQKNGLVEYLNDQLFTKSNNMDDYIYNIDKDYSGSGTINLMPSGNIISDERKNLESYLEGLARIDLQGVGLLNIFSRLADEIQSKFNPDVILIDSRTGFNNLFGTLTKLSKHIVVLAGDDIQNQPGTEYVSTLLNNKEINTSFVLSILNGDYSSRFKNFNQHIENIYGIEADTFYFDRQNVLEFIGTSLENKDDINDFINGENGSPQYQKFFKFINLSLSSQINTEEVVPSDNQVVPADDQVVPSDNQVVPADDQVVPADDQVVPSDNQVVPADKKQSLQDRILNKLEVKLPDLYAENTEYSADYINNIFYFRPCMEDFLIPEKSILLGDKGTGKTAFYKALQNKSFFQMLVKKCQRAHLNYEVLNITDIENDKFEFLGFEDRIKDELFIKRFWMFFIWQAICERGDFKSKTSIKTIDLSKTSVRSKIIELIDNDDLFSEIEEELSVINERLNYLDHRLILTFDRLDEIVKPYLWNDVIAPLVKLSINCPWNMIFPKLFLRRDLYERLGNLTNKNSFTPRVIDLEWNQNEMFSYFLKLVFSYCKDDFFEYLELYGKPPEINIQVIKKKLKTKGHEHNQLPLDTLLIQPIINLFFGSPKSRKNGKIRFAYEDLYRNIQSADKSINLRPFIDLITYAIIEQKETDAEKDVRKDSILGLVYCTMGAVRKKAVINYLTDLTNEKGNEFVQYFCQDFANDEVSTSYKKNMLYEDSFDKLIMEVRARHKDEEAVQGSTLEECKQILIANKIITAYMVGNKTRYGFAYLYTNYLGV
jgi:MinD-like ATPase involved in chromosome partitioning or flagellar assembly